MGARPEDCVVIEDSTAGVQAALAASMRVIGFTGGSHCGPEHADKLRHVGARVVIERMLELSEAIQTLTQPHP
jgi:beta-phosphoglucomutase-like phosphatase (HAD superfamily)